TGSALRYMPHGLRSRGSVAVAPILSCASAGTGTTSHAINAALRSTYAPRTQDSNSSPVPFPKFPLDQTHSATTYHAGIRALSGDPIKIDPDFVGIERAVSPWVGALWMPRGSLRMARVS